MKAYMALTIFTILKHLVSLSILKIKNDLNFIVFILILNLIQEKIQKKKH